MSTLEEIQLAIEYEFSTKHTKELIHKAIGDSDVLQNIIQQSMDLIDKWSKQAYWPAKEIRIKSFLATNNVESIINAIVASVVPLTRPVDFTAVVGPLANKFKLVDYTTQTEDYVGKVQTISEIVGLLCQTDLYDINSAAYSESGHLSIQSNYHLPPELQEHLSHLMYLPPMLVPPKIMRKNTDCGYLLDSDKNRGVVLKVHNQHNLPLALDAINIFNSTAFSLDRYVLTLEERPNKPLDTPQKAVQFHSQVEKSKRVYDLLVNTGNKFYFNHKCDKRGRINVSGYHVNLQSYEYKKALINLHKQEIIPLD